MNVCVEPKAGQIRMGKKLGYSEDDPYIGLACSRCGKVRWRRYYRSHMRRRQNICVDCTRKARVMEQGANWRGGRLKEQYGYVLIKVARDDFFYPMATQTGYIFEHRLVMAKRLNRCLLPWEVVHHKNGIKDDNRLENLTLLPSKASHIIDARTKSYIRTLELKIITLQEQLEEFRGKFEDEKP